MRLKKIKLHGFKSFADAAQLEILPGLTGVVGPNGCGKSNLVEALRWCMGESSGRTLRAEDMDDVIFAGSGRRAGRNHAEVVIGLEPDGIAANTAFAAEDELEVSRKIVREQGSVYRINGREVRARDVQLLFADGATGARSHAMIRQGQINELITDKPERRRRLLEDAAGISGLYTRRAEAESRLKSARENLMRLDDLFTELNTQQENLQKQAKTAVRYRTISGEIHLLEGKRLLEMFEGAAQSVLDAQTRIDEAKLALENATLEQTQAVKSQAIAAAKLPQIRMEAAQSGSAFVRLREEYQGLLQDIARLEAKLEAHLTRMSDAQISMDRLGSQLHDAYETMSQAQLAIQSQDEGGDGFREDIAAALEKREQKEAQLLKAEQSVSEAMALYASCRSAHETAQRALITQSDQQQQNAAKLQAVESELVELKAQNMDGVLEAQAQLQHTTEQHKLQQEQLAKSQEAFEVLRAQMLDQQQVLRRLGDDEKHLRRKMDTLRKELSLFEHHEDGRPVLLDMQLREGFERALSAALGAHLQMPLNEGGILGWVGAEILPQDLALPEGVQSLLQFVDAPNALKRRLSQIGVVDDFEQALALKDKLHCGQMIVSKGGQSVRWDGLVCQTPADLSATQVLDVKAQLLRYESEQRKSLEQLEGLRTVVGALERTCDKAKQEFEYSKTLSAELESALQMAQRHVMDEEKRQSQWEARLSALSLEVERLRQFAQECEQALQATQSQLATLQSLEDIEQILRERRSILSGAREDAAQARGQHEAVLQSQSMRQAEHSRLLRTFEESKARVKNLEAQLTQMKTQGENFEADRRNFENLLPELQAKSHTLNALMVEAEHRHSAALQAQHNAENDLKDLDYGAKRALDELNRANERQEDAQRQHDNMKQHHDALVAKVLDDYGLGIAGLRQKIEQSDLVFPPTLEKLQSRLRSLLDERERLGAVNLAAEKDLTAVSERLTTLTNEHNDLVLAIEKLEDVIDELNAEGRMRFLDTYKNVAARFEDVFKRLFGGGEAELKLVGHEDPLQCGLEVIAKPPGKKPQSLSLLSGGEQALVAVSLLFAVFLTNPAPISVLDEVDAPLDDANVERFCEMLAEISQNTSTRFLVITHNPITMARMNRLYGVTMAEAGVSQLVSVDLGRAEELINTGTIAPDQRDFLLSHG